MILEQLKVEFKIFLRMPLYLIFSTIFPVISLLMFGNIYSGQDYSGIDFFSYYIPGLCVIILFASSVFNIGNQVIMDREKGIYKRISVTPVNLTRIMFVVILKAFVVAFLGFALLLVASKIVFHAQYKTFALFLIVFIFMIIYSLTIGFSMGVLIKSAKNYSLIMMMLFLPMFMLSDAAIPLMIMPKILQKIAIINPLYNMNIILRVAWDMATYSQYKNELFTAIVVLSGLILIILLTVGFMWRKNRQ